MKDSATRQKILDAAIDSIEKNGIGNCTIRNIAEEAGITFSSILYYYESKEQLVDAAMRQAVRHSIDDLREIWKTRADDLTAIREMLLFLFDGAVKFPGITRASLHGLLMNGDTDGPAPLQINELLRGVLDDMAETHGLPRDELSLKVSGAISTVFFLGISPQAFAGCSGVDFSEPENRRRMVNGLTDGLLEP